MHSKTYKIITVVIVTIIVVIGINVFFPEYFFNKYVIQIPENIYSPVENMQSQYKIIEGETVNTYVNYTYGFKFNYPKEYTVIDNVPEQDHGILSVNFYLDGAYRGYIGAYKSDFWNPPAEVSLKEWVLSLTPEATPADSTSVQYSRKLGTEFSIGGLETVHFMDHTTSGGTYDDFYFLKDGQVFILQIAGNETISENGYITYTNINLKSNDWYMTILRSFSFE